MKTAVIVFPGSNCDRDMAVALEGVSGSKPVMVWHKDTELPQDIDLVAVPGGFSYGDYLRSGAIAARSPIMDAVRKFADAGGYVLGVCNGFQVLTEAGLLPGALMRNAGQLYICKDSQLEVVATDTIFSQNYNQGDSITLPVAHHDGNYTCDEATLNTLREQNRIVFRYRDAMNGSRDDIAGIVSENRRVLGMMPHPERAISPEIGGDDGAALFRGMMATIAA